MASLPRRRLEGAWLQWRLRVLDAGTEALREGEAEARGKAAELQASMERGLHELRIGKEGLEASFPLLRCDRNKRYLSQNPRHFVLPTQNTHHSTRGLLV